MSLLKDLERGIPEDEELQLPLLDNDNVNNSDTIRIRPPRPTNLNLSNLPQSSSRSPRDPKVSLSESTTTSVASSPTNTPVLETIDIVPKKWRRSDRRLRRLNTELLEAIENHVVEEAERLLNAGANPNATCRLGLVSACHVAALTGGNALTLLVKFGAEKHRQDKLGRTPLHLAAWAGNPRQMAILLDFPEEIQDRVDRDSLSSETEEDVRKHCTMAKNTVDVRCDLGEVIPTLPKTWKDNIDHNCRDITGTLPLIQPGWTPLHVASACGRRHCTRLLLAAGANPNVCDVAGRTPLDVAGFAHYYNETITSKNFTEVIKMLLKAGARHNTMKCRGLNNVTTPLHTAVEIGSRDAVTALLDAGASIACLNKSGLTPLHVCVEQKAEEILQMLANHGNNDVDPLQAMVDVKDAEGYTVLQAAVKAAWIPGVCVALEAGADVTLRANDGETPIHSAAALGNLDVLTEIFSVAKQKQFIDCQNEGGETPLYKAIIHGHLNCVLAILNHGASVKITLPGDVNVFHVASEYGQVDILRELLNHDEEVTKAMINSLTTGERRGFGPIHFAASHNHIDCVELLLSKNADIRLRTTCSPHKSSTPLHIAATKNHLGIARALLNFDKTTIHEVNGLGWFPLHSATHHGSRDVITLLLQEGADLSGYTDGPKKYRKTAIDMLINNLSKSTEYMEDVFDSYITMNCQNIQDPDCVISIDYRVLMPSVCETEQMKVIEALLKTGNRYGQKRLLVHPLMESFLHLKWKALLPFFYTIITLYALFVLSLTTFIVSVFFYKDTKDTAPVWLNANVWGYIVYSSICLVLLQELIYMNIKSSRYFLQLETWVKFGSIGFAVILPPVVTVTAWSSAEWPRHVATVALLLSWLEMMFLLSRFPNGGYYVLMFGKVASNVIKILLTFAFLVIGFSLSFMVQFRSQMPFEGPWAAFVKTIVMMTSEFDYEGLFDEQHSKELATSIMVVRLIFIIFLVLAAIVLMNLMVGVAVNDINDLEILGNIRRLAKQVEFLSTLDVLVYNRVFGAIFPHKVNKSIRNKRRVPGVILLSPGKPRWKHYKVIPSRLRDAIFLKAQTQKKQKDDELGVQVFRQKLDEMHQAIVKKDVNIEENEDLPKIEDKPSVLKDFRDKIRHDEVMKHLEVLDSNVKEMKGQIQDTKSIETLNDRIEEMSLEILGIKHFLMKLESKLDKL